MLFTSYGVSPRTKPRSQKRRGHSIRCVEVLENRVQPSSIVGFTAIGGVTALNNSGEVVGAPASGNSTAEVFNINSQRLVNLGTLAGGALSFGRGINDAGQVVGYSQIDSVGDAHAFLWSSATGMVDLGTLPGYTQSGAAAINDSGQVVGGASYDPKDGTHGARSAFLYTSAGGMIDLGTLGGYFGAASAINDAGQVVGTSTTAPPVPDFFGTGQPYAPTYAFVWSEATGMVNLGTLPGDNTSEATAINDSGEVVGDSQLVKGGGMGEITHAFLYTGEGGMIDLGTLGGEDSAATGVNDSGLVIGDSSIDPGNVNAPSYAFIWSKATGMVNLNSLLPPSSGWVLNSAIAINNEGQIIGSGNNGAYLLNLAAIEPNSLNWSTDDGGVDFSYQILGRSLPQATTVALYWAPSTTFDSSEDTLIPASVVNTQTAAGTYGPFHVTPARLGKQPQSAKYVLAVADPNGLLGELDDSDNTEAIPITSKVIPDSVMPQDDGSLVVNYEVSAPVSAEEPVPIGVYWASGPDGSSALTDDASDALFTYNVSSEGPGSYTFTIPADNLTTAPPQTTYLLVVADPSVNLDGDRDPKAILPVQAYLDDLTAEQLQQLMTGIDTADAARYVRGAEPDDDGVWHRFAGAVRHVPGPIG